MDTQKARKHENYSLISDCISLWLITAPECVRTSLWFKNVCLLQVRSMNTWMCHGGDSVLRHGQTVLRHWVCTSTLCHVALLWSSCWIEKHCYELLPWSSRAAHQNLHWSEKTGPSSPRFFNSGRNLGAAGAKLASSSILYRPESSCSLCWPMATFLFL